MFIRSGKSYVAAACLVAMLGFQTTVSQAQTVTMESASIDSLVGMLPRIWSEYTTRDGIEIKLSLDRTLTKSLLKVAVGQIESGVAPPHAVLALQAGKGPYTRMHDRAVAVAGNVRSLFGFLASAYHPITWADSGIKTWADIKGKRVFIGPPAGSAAVQITAMIEDVAGLKEGKDYTGVKVPWAAAEQGFLDGKYDVYVAGAGISLNSVVEVSRQRRIHLIGMPAEQVPDPGLYLEKQVISPMTYAGQIDNDKVVTLWATTMGLVVRKVMTDELAYKLTKNYWTHFDEIKAGNAILSPLGSDNPFTGVIAPLHPGALKYYREAGIEVPANLMGG